MKEDFSYKVLAEFANQSVNRLSSEDYERIIPLIARNLSIDVPTVAYVIRSAVESRR